MDKFIPLSVPCLCGNEKKYVDEAIDSEWVSTAGTFVSNFEADIEKYLQVENAVACQSGTASIHLALRVLGVEPGEKVIVPTLTFIATINPVSYVGASPIFMDCDENLCIDIEKLEVFCRDECYLEAGRLFHKADSRPISTIIPVHVFGNMVDMERLMVIAQKYGLAVIEDATEAIGSKYIDGKYKGQFAGTIGDIGCLSFNGNKIMTTGGGGMMISNHHPLAQKAKYLSTQAKDDIIKFVHNEVGYNYRMTNVQAAMGIGQLEQLEQFVEVKSRNYKRYREAFADGRIGYILPFKEGIRPNYWFYSLVLKNPLDKDDIIKWLSNHQIQVRPVWKLNHTQKPYLDDCAYQIDKAYFYHERIINLPCSTNLSIEDVDYVIACIKGFYNKQDYYHGEY